MIFTFEILQFFFVVYYFIAEDITIKTPHYLVF